MRRTRNIQLLIPCTLAGAATTIAVAWICAASASRRPASTDAQWRGPDAAAQGWPGASSPDRPPPDSVRREEWFGMERWTVTASPGQFTRIILFSCRETAGWPARALSASGMLPDAPGVRLCLPGEPPPRLRAMGAQGIVIRTDFTGVTFREIRLPVIPTWGFAVNTVLYTSALYALALLALHYRSVLRLRKGRCPQCVYPCPPYSQCPECGSQTPRDAG